MTAFLAESLSLIGDEEEEFLEDNYLEEEEMMSGQDVMSETMTLRNMGAGGRNNSGHPGMKRRRVFRISRGRERQRGERWGGGGIWFRKNFGEWSNIIHNHSY